MRRIVVANPKGGSGKTTVSVNLAAFLAACGQRVILEDHDRQSCCEDWSKARPASQAAVQVRAAHRRDFDPDAGDSADFVVMDLPAACHDDQLAEKISRADLLIMPVLPSIVDLRSMVRFCFELTRQQVLERPGLRYCLLPNRANKQTISFRELADSLGRMRMPCHTYLRDSQNYVHAMRQGLSIFELPTRQVIRDLVLWQPLIDWVFPGESVSVLLEDRSDIGIRCSFERAQRRQDPVSELRLEVPDAG